jgi:hypothetical protein
MPQKLTISEFSGLRPKSELDHTPQYLSDCDNIYISDGGIFEAESFTRTFSLDEEAQIFQTRVGIFVAAATGIYEYVDSTLTLKIATSTDNGLWSCADFGVFILFSNGVDIVVRSPVDGTFHVDNDIVPTANWICVHRGRICFVGSQKYAEMLEIFGMPFSNADSSEFLYNNFAGWSKINEIKFQSPDTPDRTNLSGYMPMEFSGKLLRCEPLKRHWIVYGDNGVAALTLAGTLGYGLTTIHNAGIKDSGSVCLNGVGDGATAHYFIDTHGDLYILSADLSLKKLWYREFLDDTPIRMSYHKSRDELLVNLNNDETFVFGEFGMTKLTGDIQDIAEKDDETIVHAPAAITQDDLTITTNVFDFDSNCLKYLWGFTANLVCPDDVSIRIYHRTARGDSWSSTTARNFDKALCYFNAGRVCGMEFYIEFTVSNYTTFQLNDIVIKYSKVSSGLEDE